MRGCHVSLQVSKEVVATVTHLKQRAGFPIKESLRILGPPRATYFRWSPTNGKQPRPAAIVPRGHFLVPEEREVIVAYKRQHPELG